jgi:hypothetical protein
MRPLRLRDLARLAGLGLWLAVLAALPPALRAEPFVPTDDAQVVETLPRSIGPGLGRPARRALRDELRRNPQALPLALQAARDAIDRARHDGDPRELGQAQAALAPWWPLAEPPAAVRLLRATVRQSQHEFGAALADLDALLRDGSTAPLPVQAQAELTRAAILRVQGRYAEAAAGCARLAGPRHAALGPAGQAIAAVCAADLQGLTGPAQPVQGRLAQLAREPAAQAMQGWIAIVRAELAERSGDAAAEALYRDALRHDRDAYTLAAYADWLLDRQRAADVEPLLAGRSEADALLLRQAIAWQQLDDPRAGPAIAKLAARFGAARQRGETTHQREEAMFALHLRRDPAAALALARANWEQQREPADARVLWDAALAAGNAAAAGLVRRFQRDSGLLDVRLNGRNVMNKLARKS